MGAMLGETFQEQPQENVKGDRSAKELTFHAILSDPKTLCAVCKVCLQGFKWFGYALPDGCAKDKCALAGVDL